MALYLLPNTLGTRQVQELPAVIGDILPKMKGLIVESERAGRAFLSLWKVPEPHRFPLAVLSKQKLTIKACDFYLDPILKKQECWGLLSDAGLPCIADPGMHLVRRARTLGISVKGISGPCSITLALMLSGLPGQKFTFLGYLPQQPRERMLFLRKPFDKGHTQICIETPYRNKYVFETLLQALPKHAELCVAIDLTGNQEFVDTRPIESWLCAVDLETVMEHMTKVPAIFLFCIH